jgi:hypothetical protein
VRECLCVYVYPRGVIIPHSCPHRREMEENADGDTHYSMLFVFEQESNFAAHILTQVRSHTHTHTYTHMYIYIYTSMYIHAHSHITTHTHSLTHALTHTHTHIHKHTGPTDRRSQTHAYQQKWIRGIIFLNRALLLTCDADC